LVVREAHYTGEIMLIFSVNNLYFENKKWGEFKKEFNNFIQKLTKKYSNIKSVYLLKNSGKADIVQ